MKRLTSFLLVLIIFVVFSCEKNEQAGNDIQVVFYNVENLFDLNDEPGKADEEFTPEGSKKWDEVRYQKKIDDIARVLSSIDTVDLPEVIGLCEVENQSVLKDLVSSASLDAGHYKIVHYESPDFRGIDVAFLYKGSDFKVVGSQAIPISFEDEPDYFTRDILYVKGKLKGEETFHFFMNHWPSRIGGTEKTEPKRVTVAQIIRLKIDSILAVDSNDNIVVMGDMNDEPNNKSLFETLNAKHPDLAGEQDLVNLMYPVDEEGRGSYNYRGNWNTLDNIVVSPSLLDGKGFDCVGNGNVFSQPWMEYKSENGNISPNRTYGGPNYYGGVSDHFPVYFIMKKNGI